MKIIFSLFLGIWFVVYLPLDILNVFDEKDPNTQGLVFAQGTEEDAGEVVEDEGTEDQVYDEGQYDDEGYDYGGYEDQGYDDVEEESGELEEPYEVEEPTPTEEPIENQ